MHLWRTQGLERAWTPVEIPEAGLSLRRRDDGTVELSEGLLEGAFAVVIPFEENAVARAALLPLGDAAPLLVNAYRPLGVALLDDQDELIVEDEVLYFGARSPTRVGRFEGIAGDARCARCKLQLREGDSVARCPACHAYHHAGALAGEARELGCWSHDTRCGSCQRIREQMLWTPEDLENDRGS